MDSVKNITLTIFIVLLCWSFKPIDKAALCDMGISNPEYIEVLSKGFIPYTYIYCDSRERCLILSFKNDSILTITNNSLNDESKFNFIEEYIYTMNIARVSVDSLIYSTREISPKIKHNYISPYNKGYKTNFEIFPNLIGDTISQFFLSENDIEKPYEKMYVNGFLFTRVNNDSIDAFRYEILNEINNISICNNCFSYPMTYQLYGGCPKCLYITLVNDSSLILENDVASKNLFINELYKNFSFIEKYRIQLTYDYPIKIVIESLISTNRTNNILIKCLSEDSTSHKIPVEYGPLYKTAYDVIPDISGDTLYLIPSTNRQKGFIYWQNQLFKLCDYIKETNKYNNLSLLI